MEARFDTLTFKHLCQIAHRAHLTQYDLTSVDGVIHHRETVVPILKRRYIFGIIAALFKPLNSNVFECIAKFVDFDIVWQARVQKYVSLACSRYKNSHARAIIEWRRSNALFLAHHVLNVHNTGRKNRIMSWIAESPEHQFAYYQFKKERNIAYQTELAKIEKSQKDAKQECVQTRDLMKYAESSANFQRLESELREMYGKQEPDWVLNYGWTNFPESTELLYTNPQSLEQ